MEAETKKPYELSYYLSPEIDEAEILNFAAKIKNFILEADGTIISEIPPQKRKIAQPIKKSNFGYFGVFHFQCEPDKIDELKNNIKSESKILRHMIVAQKLQTRPKKEKKKEKASFLKLYKKPGKTAVPLEKPLTQPQPEIKSEKIELEKEKIQMEELEKKLEEILKE